MTPAFFTIGHSNRSLTAFLDLLHGAEINHLADIRTIPMSRANPQFNGDALAAALAEQAISYEHIAALGGLRGKATGIPAERNGLWRNDSFHNYADYALSPAFQDGLRHLLAVGADHRCAVMCAEAVWWRCHRRIVADYLIVQGAAVFHILGPGQISPAALTRGAKPGPDGTVSYPRQT